MKNIVGGLVLLDIKNYYKTVVILIVSFRYKYGQYLTTNPEKMDKSLKKKVQIEDSTNNGSISKQENKSYSAILFYAFCLNTEILSNWILETIPYS